MGTIRKAKSKAAKKTAIKTIKLVEKTSRKCGKTVRRLVRIGDIDITTDANQ